MVLSQEEELAKKKNELKKELLTFVSKLQQVNLIKLPFERSEKQIARIKTVQSEVK